MTSDIVACASCGQKNRLPAASSGLPRCAKCKAGLPWVVSAGDADFGRVAEQANLPVLVDLWAPWCMPCRVVEPGVARAATELAGKLKVVKVNVDNAPRLSQRFQARSIPMLLLMRDGKVIGQRVGALPPEALMTFVRNALAA